MHKNQFSLRFHEKALAEWQRLDGTVREMFKKKLAERLTTPRVPSAALHQMPDCYKIKLHALGYRLVYRVEDTTVFVSVIAVGKRDKMIVYKEAAKRL
jgi:mRNA interferase RelE/StbE